MISVGDKVTVIGYTSRTSFGEPPVCVLARAHVVDVDDSEFNWMATHSEIDNTTSLSSARHGTCAFAEQGGCWVEGWPAFDSPEISALRSAWLLAPGAVPHVTMDDWSSADVGWYDDDLDDRDHLGREFKP